MTLRQDAFYLMLDELNQFVLSIVARAFPGVRAAHLEDQNEEENLRKNYKTFKDMRKDWGNVLILPTWQWEVD